MKPDLPMTLPQMTSNEVDLGAYLDTILESRRLVAAIAAAFIVLGVLYAVLAPPVYRADIMLQVEDSTDGAAGGNLVANVSSLFQVKSVTAGEIEILRSRLVVATAVDKLRLYIDADPVRFPLIGDWIARRQRGLSTPGLMGMGGYAWGAERIAVERFDVPRALEELPFRVVALGNGRYRLDGKALDGAAGPREGAVGQTLIVPTLDGAVALHVTAMEARAGAEFEVVRHSRNGIVESIQKQLDIQEKGKQQSGVIGVRLEGTDPDLTARTMNEIGAEYVRQNVDRKSAEAAKSLEFLDGELPKLKATLERAEARFNDYRRAHGVIDVSDEARLTLQYAVDAQTQLLGLEQKRSDLNSRFAANHPSIGTIDEQIGALRRVLGDVDKRIRKLPAVEQEVVRLRRDVQVNNELYLALLQSAQQLSLLKAGKVGSVRVVDEAVQPELPVKPVAWLVVAVSAVVGLFVGMIAAIVRDRMFGGITDVDEIERYVGMSVYATIPSAQPQRELTRQVSAKAAGTHLLAITHPHEPAVESLRSLRTALQFAMIDAPNNIVFVTGPTPGVGKSFISANFSALIASAGKRVLLIDGDLRRGYLNQYFGRTRERGVSDVLAGTCELASAIHRTPIDNLDFLSTGALPPNPSELLHSPAMAALLAEVSAQYDVVLLDGPPALAVSDAVILAPLAGITFVVARAGRTRAGELAEIQRRLEQNGVNVKGVLLNYLNPRSGRQSYGGKYGSYRYVAYEYAPAKH
ncbi:polysaccharide biosynthesis tyrosine autokinase [Cupriavidus sp. OTU4054]